MSGKLLDTNAVIALQNGDPGIREFLQKNDVIVPSIVLGELYYGAYRSGRLQDNLAIIEDFATSSKILNCDVATARLYGAIKQQLKLKGRPIPENDIWIAAIAQQHGLTLVTQDTHFEAVDGLQLESW